MTDIFLKLRSAGQVQRDHTRPHIGSYSIAEHCYQCLNIVLQYHPNPSIDLIKAVVYHDSAEMIVGDVPAPAKWRFDSLRHAVRNAEFQILKELRLARVLDLDPDSQHWLDAVDLLEFGLWCCDQLDLGNRLVYVALERVIARFQDSAPPPRLIHLIDHLVSYQSRYCHVRSESNVS